MRNNIEGKENGIYYIKKFRLKSVKDLYGRLPNGRIWLGLYKGTGTY